MPIPALDARVADGRIYRSDTTRGWGTAPGKSTVPFSFYPFAQVQSSNRPELRLDPEFVLFLNQHAQVVGEQLA
jgi:hypothetical protein